MPHIFYKALALNKCIYRSVVNKLVSCRSCTLVCKEPIHVYIEHSAVTAPFCYTFKVTALRERNAD